MGGKKLGETRDNDLKSDRDRDAHHEAARDRVAVTCRGAGALHRSEDAHRLRVEAMPRVGQLQTSVRAQQKLYVEVGFERMELPANRRKGKAERPRRGGKASGVPDPHEQI